MKLVSSPLPAGAYFNEVTPKDMVLLHFTAGGSASGAIETFKNYPKTNGYPVSTHYVVDTDGTVYKLFEERYWSYHLGIKGNDAEKHRHDKRSVAIEIVNVGALRIKGDLMCYWPPLDKNGLPLFTSKFCAIGDRPKYVRLQTSWRDETFFAAFPQAQIDAAAELTNDICTRIGIPKRIPPPDRMFDFDIGFYKKFVGVTSHVNWRPDKTDLAPVQSEPIWAELIQRYSFESTSVHLNEQSLPPRIS